MSSSSNVSVDEPTNINASFTLSDTPRRENDISMEEEDLLDENEDTGRTMSSLSKPESILLDESPIEKQKDPTQAAKTNHNPDSIDQNMALVKEFKSKKTETKKTKSRKRGSDEESASAKKEKKKKKKKKKSKGDFFDELFG